MTMVLSLSAPAFASDANHEEICVQEHLIFVVEDNESVSFVEIDPFIL